MDTRRKRQKVSSACERCHKRKLGCDPLRPCQLCERAGVPCISRGRSTSQVEEIAQGGEHGPAGPSKDNEAVIFSDTNIFDLSVGILASEDRSFNFDYDTSALPGGKKTPNKISSSIPWRDMIGISLPSRACLDILVDVFFQTVDWFVMVLHEESFRQRYESLMASTELPATEDINFVWLVLLVHAMGSHYLSLTVLKPQKTLILQQLSQSFLEQLEAKFLKIIGSANVEAVQICVLMGSFHIFNGRPPVGLGVLESGIRLGQFIGLHREPMNQVDPISVLESRRRTWLTLEIFDKYATIVFGRPCGIDDSKCNFNINNSDIVNSSEIINRQSRHTEYHQCKVQLYRIIGRFLNHKLDRKRLEMVTGIHNQLASWESQLPHKLRLETYRGKDTSQPLLLRMQALLLQLSYDNVLIFLHRSAAFGISSKGSSEYHSAPILSGSAFSQQQLLNSALRTSELYQYRALLQACRRTHAAMHIGICLFTAGVILCTFALSRPLSSSAEKAKAGVANILRLHQNSVLGEHLLSTQSAKVLTDLVAAVMRSEQKFILGQQDKNNSTSTQSATEYTTISTIEKSVTPYTPAPTEDQSPTLLASVSQATTPNNHHDSFTPETDRAPIELFEELLSADSIAELIWDGDMPTFTDPNLPDTSSFWP